METLDEMKIAANKSTPSVTAEQAETARLRAEIARLQGLVAAKRPLKFQVGQKGGVSVYNLGRFPVTLFYGQWKRLLKAAVELEIFIDEQYEQGKLATKDGDEQYA